MDEDDIGISLTELRDLDRAIGMALCRRDATMEGLMHAMMSVFLLRVRGMDNWQVFVLWRANG